MGVKQESGDTEKILPPVKQEFSHEMDTKVKKYLGGEGANLEVIKDKKLKAQLSAREDLYGISAKAAANAEGIEKTSNDQS